MLCRLGRFLLMNLICFLRFRVNRWCRLVWCSDWVFFLLLMVCRVIFLFLFINVGKFIILWLLMCILSNLGSVLKFYVVRLDSLFLLIGVLLFFLILILVLVKFCLMWLVYWVCSLGSECDMVSVLLCLLSRWKFMNRCGCNLLVWKVFSGNFMLSFFLIVCVSVCINGFVVLVIVL